MKSRLMLAAGFILSAMVVWPAMSSTPWQRVSGEDYSSGAYLYRAFCATCHGESGKGDGPVADLAARRPSDLTALTRRANGVFPRTRVMHVLDGTLRVPEHDAPAMPNWPRVLRKTEGDDERVIRQRLEALVSHLESLQR